MTTSHDVRIWDIKAQKRKRSTSYTVRWVVAGRLPPFSQTFVTSALAGAYRSKLMTAAKAGEAFDAERGLPLSWIREELGRITCYEFFRGYLDYRWKSSAPITRRVDAESLASVTLALAAEPLDETFARGLYSALTKWAYNRAERKRHPLPGEYAPFIEWIEAHSLPLISLDDPAIVRQAFDGIGMSLAGVPYAGNSFATKRRAFRGAVEYAIEEGYFTVNPLRRVRSPRPRLAQSVDRRCVVNPLQARALIEATRGCGRTGPRLMAFYATIYYAGLRPGEVLALRDDNCHLPETGWGELSFEESTPRAGASWTDDGTVRPRKALKHRAPGEGRTVPAPPALVALLRAHIDEFGTAPDGTVFVTAAGEPLSQPTYDRIWKQARTRVLTTAQASSPLARKVYDLRHACLSTWLNAGVPAAQVAEWAGHTVEVLLRTYAKCLDGGGEEARRRIEEAFGTGTAPEEPEAPPDLAEDQ